MDKNREMLMNYAKTLADHNYGNGMFDTELGDQVNDYLFHAGMKDLVDDCLWMAGNVAVKRHHDVQPGVALKQRPDIAPDFENENIGKAYQDIIFSFQTHLNSQFRQLPADAQHEFFTFLNDKSFELRNTMNDTAKTIYPPMKGVTYPNGKFIDFNAFEPNEVAKMLPDLQRQSFMKTRIAAYQAMGKQPNEVGLQAEYDYLYLLKKHQQDQGKEQWLQDMIKTAYQTIDQNRQVADPEKGM